MLKIRRPLGRLIFNMGIAIPGKTVFLIETAPRVLKLHYLYYWRHDSLQHHKHAAPSSAHLIMKYQYMLITLNMLIYFKHYKINGHIFNLILDLAWLKLMKLNLEQQYILSALHSQYHVCWCPGDFRSQGISRNGIDSQSQNIRRVNTY